MKAVKSFDVMESFGMKEMNPEELMEVDGGFCFINIENNGNNGSNNSNSSNNGNGTGNKGAGNGNGSGTGNGNGQNNGNLRDRGYPSSMQGY